MEYLVLQQCYTCHDNMCDVQHVVHYAPGLGPQRARQQKKTAKRGEAQRAKTKRERERESKKSVSRQGVIVNVTWCPLFLSVRRMVLHGSMGGGGLCGNAAAGTGYRRERAGTPRQSGLGPKITSSKRKPVRLFVDPDESFHWARRGVEIPTVSRASSV